MGVHAKIAPKRNRLGILRLPLGATAPICHTFLQSSFHEKHASILNPLSYLATRKNIQKFNIFGLLGGITGRLPPRTVHFEKALFTGYIFLQIVYFYLEPVKSYKASKLTMLKIDKKATYFSYNGFTWGTISCHTFSESSRRADVKL